MKYLEIGVILVYGRDVVMKCALCGKYDHLNGTAGLGRAPKDRKSD